MVKKFQPFPFETIFFSQKSEIVYVNSPLISNHFYGSAYRFYWWIWAFSRRSHLNWFCAVTYTCREKKERKEEFSYHTKSKLLKQLNFFVNSMLIWKRKIIKGSILRSLQKIYVMSAIRLRISILNQIPCGLKNPAIQKHGGRPLKHHVLNCTSRSSNSVNQKPSVLAAQDPLIHTAGTNASYILSRAS